jgi:hypothetical protein
MQLSLVNAAGEHTPEDLDYPCGCDSPIP